MNTPSHTEIEIIKNNTQAVYERQAKYWDNLRQNKLFDKMWLDLFLETLPKKAQLLDLGCGSGRPVAGYFLEQGFHVTGLDYSETMIALARNNYPQGAWQVGDIRALNIETQFNGIYSWDGFFHLSVEEQRRALPLIAKQVASGGSLFLTVGPDEGEVTGTVGDETVYHASLSPEEYRHIMTNLGFKNVQFLTKGAEEISRCAILATHMR